MSYADTIVIPDQRLVILKALAEDRGYSHNDSILQDILQYWSHDVSRDLVRTHLSWLQEQGLVTIEILEGGVYKATITSRGADAACGRATVPGVKRPSPRS